MDTVNLIFKIVYCFGWLLSLFVLFCARVRLKRIEKELKKGESEMSDNKAKQIEKEKEVKSMGKFLCDACGKETEVKAAKQYKNYDVCPDCYDKIIAMNNDCIKAAKEVEEAEAKANAARARFEQLSGELNRLAVDSTVAADKQENTVPAATDANVDDVLKNLGL